MNCKTIHNKLIFFVEKSLSNEEMVNIQNHLNKCNNCFFFSEELKTTLEIIKTEKAATINPFFYTQIKARLENETIQHNHFYRRLLQPVLLSILLLLGIYSGIRIGQQPNILKHTANITEQEVIPFLNELDNEPLENFLIVQ